MYVQSFICTLVAVTAFAAEPSTNVPNRCPQPTDKTPDPLAYYYGHPYDCGYFFSCAHGHPYMMPCPPGTVWNQELTTCVMLRSELDKCSSTRESEQNPCSSGGSIIPDPNYCNRYTNCSNNETSASRFLKQGEFECPYPYLLDYYELKCKAYNETNCGPSRVATKDPCNWMVNVCGAAHCEPCPSRIPSCVGLPDGEHEHPKKPGTPYHIICLNEILVRILYCTRLAPTQTDSNPTYTHPCRSIWPTFEEATN